MENHNSMASSKGEMRMGSSKRGRMKRRREGTRGRR
jgi:hypothetical protein